MESEALLQSCVSGGPECALPEWPPPGSAKARSPPAACKDIAEKRHRAPLSGRQVWGSVYMALWGDQSSPGTCAVEERTRHFVGHTTTK